MKKINLFAILFAITSVLFFAGCDNDNDKKDGDVTPPVEDCFCDEAKTVACPDGGKDACTKPAPTCDPACNVETEDCLCEADKCECRAKDATADDTCKDKAENDACGDNKVCMKDGNALVCKDKQADPSAADDPCKDKEAGADCGDNKVCTAGDDGKLACADKPADPPADSCKDKSEGDACGENKTCQKEADVLTCKEAAAPTQPDPAE